MTLLLHNIIYSNFNSRPSARGDSNAAMTAIESGLFQFTPLREGRHPAHVAEIRSTLFQFTPLREGRRSSCCPVLVH